MGLIRLSTICGEALDHLAPELLMADIDTLADVFEFAQLEAARTAGSTDGTRGFDKPRRPLG